MKQHELHGFFRSYTRKLAEDYEAIRARVNEDPGTAGDQGEESWRKLLEDWLPEGYTVVTKGRILGANGEASPQIDIVILKPNYPKFLKKEKYYFMGGVAAAFECKTTLRGHHIDEAVATAKKIASLQKKSETSPQAEVFSPIIYGILAHTHQWKGPEIETVDRISDRLRQVSRAVAEEPRELVELFCIADLASWRVAHIPRTDIIISEHNVADAASRRAAALKLTERFEGVPYSFYEPRPDYSRIIIEIPHSTFSVLHPQRFASDPGYSEWVSRYSAVGSFISSLYDKLSYRDPSLVNITEYFESVHIPYSSGSLNPLNADFEWRRDVISDGVWERWNDGMSGKEWQGYYF